MPLLQMSDECMSQILFKSSINEENSKMLQLVQRRILRNVFGCVERQRYRYRCRYRHRYLRAF